MSPATLLSRPLEPFFRPVDAACGIDVTLVAQLLDKARFTQRLTHSQEVLGVLPVLGVDTDDVAVERLLTVGSGNLCAQDLAGARQAPDALPGLIDLVRGPKDAPFAGAIGGFK